MRRVNQLVFVLLYSIASIIVFQEPFQSLMIGTGTTVFQTSPQYTDGIVFPYFLVSIYKHIFKFQF